MSCGRTGLIWQADPCWHCSGPVHFTGGKVLAIARSCQLSSAWPNLRSHPPSQVAHTPPSPLPFLRRRKRSGSPWRLRSSSRRGPSTLPPGTSLPPRTAPTRSSYARHTEAQSRKARETIRTEREDFGGKIEKSERRLHKFTNSFRGTGSCRPIHRAP